MNDSQDDFDIRSIRGKLLYEISLNSTCDKLLMILESSPPIDMIECLMRSLNIVSSKVAEMDEEMWEIYFAFTKKGLKIAENVLEKLDQSRKRVK